MTSAPELDMAKAEAFGGKMLGFLNGWSAAMCLSVGHHTGLFDTMAGRAPSSSQQIADAAGLDEHYVREWLHAMVVSGVIEYDQAARTYALPPEHAGAVTRAAGPTTPPRSRRRSRCWLPSRASSSRPSRRGPVSRT